MESNVVSKRFCKRVWYLLSSYLTIAIAVVALFLVGLRVFGYQMFTVTSGSMEPNYPVGSLIYTRPVVATELKEGDVISFMNNETTVVTHRIEEVVSEVDATGETVLKFRTKGDANAVSDSRLVHYKNVIGTPTVVIPKLGYLAYYLQRPPGIYISLIVCTFLISLIFIPHITKLKGKEQTIAEI